VLSACPCQNADEKKLLYKEFSLGRLLAKPEMEKAEALAPFACAASLCEPTANPNGSPL